MWAAMTEVWPDYDEYQTKTSREIPVVVLERVGEQGGWLGGQRR